MALNYYDVLGLGQNATNRQIKAAYRKLALQYHPDRNPGSMSAQIKFLEISDAYHVLINEERRARYDWSLHADDLEAFHRYWEQVKPQKRPPPPPYYYQYAREKVVYSPRTYVLGALAVLAIVGIALLVPFFLLQISAEQNYQKAVDHYLMGKYTTSLHYLDIAMSEVSSKNAAAATLAGIILTYKIKNPDYALKYIHKGLKYTENDSLRSELQYLEGLCYYHKGMPVEAATAFEAVGDQGAKKDSAIYMAGIVYLTQMQDPTKAMEYFDTALLHNNDFDKARYYRGLARQKAQRYDDAIDDFQYLIDDNFQPAASYYHKARCEIQQDRLDDACLDLKMAMRYQLEEAQTLYALYCLDTADVNYRAPTRRTP